MGEITLIMDISVIGSGYVGSTISACLATWGHTVQTVDIDQGPVDDINHGKAPIHEPGLDELIANHSGSRLYATTDYSAICDTDVTFLALPTPSHDDGSIDLDIIKTATQSVGEALVEKDNSHLVVVKSTVLPGTTNEELTPVIAEASGKSHGEDLHVAMNPEFLREGSAVSDFRHPDKVVIGTSTELARTYLRAIFEPLVTNSETAIVETGICEAEMIKYANNAFLATKVSLINELGNICKEYGVDSYEVAEALGFDDRISAHFLRSGVGWGGSCFPKDIEALIAAAREKGYEPSLLDAAVEVNEIQPLRLLECLQKHIELSGKQIAVLGLAFKPGTDDVRNSRAIPVIEELQQQGATVVAYDPVAGENMQERFPDIKYADSAAAALDGAHGALVVTDWDEFKTLDSEFDAMTEPILIDGRRVVEPQPELVAEGLTW